jgi:hypothetical protein
MSSPFCFQAEKRETDVRAGDGGTWAFQVRVANAWQQRSRSLTFAFSV